MPIPVQLALYIFLVVAVLYYMWQMQGDPSKFYGWCPPLAITSVWSGLVSAVGTIYIYFFATSTQTASSWITTTMIFLTPFAATTGILVLWVYRKEDRQELEETIFLQITQAKVGIFLASIGIILGYIITLS